MRDSYAHNLPVQRYIFSMVIYGKLLLEKYLDIKSPCTYNNSTRIFDILFVNVSPLTGMRSPNK